MPPSSITTSPACSLPPPYPSLPLHSSRFPRRLDRDPAFPAARPLARPPPLLLRAGNMYKYYLEIGTWFQFYAKITFSIVHSFRVGSVTRDGIALDRNKKQNRVRCCAKREEESESGAVKEKSVSVVLLAGGTGKRMGASMPKQYLPLLGQPIALYSFYIFSQMSEVKEIVVVCDPSYKDIFEDASENIQVDLKFALPGKERQDSVFNGFQEIDGSSELVCIHDSARPLVRCEDIKKVLKDAWLNGAAVLGVPVKATIKEAGSDSFVVKTLDRKTLWEMQTPQVSKPNLLRDGFELVNKKGLEVTDDVSIVEHLKHPVYITEGSYTNIKVTTPDDLLLAERVLNMSVGVPS